MPHGLPPSATRRSFLASRLARIGFASFNAKGTRGRSARQETYSPSVKCMGRILSTSPSSASYVPRHTSTKWRPTSTTATLPIHPTRSRKSTALRIATIDSGFAVGGGDADPSRVEHPGKFSSIWALLRLVSIEEAQPIKLRHFSARSGALSRRYGQFTVGGMMGGK
jgi:hypothetical protein